MSAAAALTSDTRKIPAIDAFRARCEARAWLVAAGEMSLHEAVDELQASAVASGIVDAIGQDYVQAIMSTAFAQNG